MFNKILILLIVLVALLYGVFPGQEKARDRIREGVRTAGKVADVSGVTKNLTSGHAFKRIDLEDYEDGAHEGHTIARHVGKSDAWLKQRLKDNTRIPAASTFPDLESANETVNAALQAKWQDITAWLADEEGRDTMNVRKRFDDPVGRGIERGAAEAEDYYRVIVRLEKDKDRFVIWTAYPEP